MRTEMGQVRRTEARHLSKKKMPEGETNNNSLNAPVGITFDNRSNLWVTDGSNNRILMYRANKRNPELFYNGQPASIVLGQPDFVSNGAPNPPTPSSLNFPTSIAFDASNIWVCDYLNNRVLMYKADSTNPDLFYNGQPASIVLGQQEFDGTMGQS